MLNIDDSKSRELIANDTSHNFFVEAGAGSGKTTELVNRMVAMVEHGVNGQDIDISQICAITFTKAAANEFYDRFQKQLAESDSPKAKAALENIDLCFMGTIDSFCNMVMSEHPAEGKIPSDARVVDDDEMKQLMLAELVNIAHGDYGQELKFKYDRYVKYCDNIQGYFISGLQFLFSTKNTKLKFKQAPKQDFEQIFGNEINEIKEAFEYFSNNKEVFSKSSNSDKQTIKWIDAAKDVIDGPWDDLLNIKRTINNFCGNNGLRLPIGTDINKLDMPKYLKSIFVEGVTKTGKASFWTIPDIKDGGNPFHKKEIENYIFTIAIDFISSASLEISKRFRASGTLSFSDYLFYLKEMLKEDAKCGGKLISHIYNRHKYYLIDEFQDTDPVQAEIFFYLTASNLDSAKSWKECIPYPGSLFIVGDPKQSIYRFRNADVSSYLNVKKLFENDSVGKVLNLTNNYRSSKDMCSWFNDTFKVLLKQDDGIQAAYQDIPLDSKANYKGSLSGAYKHCYLNTKSFKDNPGPANLASIIGEIVDNPNYTIQDSPKKGQKPPEPRKIKYSDIMVISYKKNKLKYYMNALNKANIPYYIEGNVMFDDCHALFAVWAFMNLLSDPDNKRSHVGIKYMTNNVDEKEVVSKYLETSKRISPSSLFSLILDSENIIGQMGTRNLEYLYYAQELLKSKELSGEISCLSQAADFINSLIFDDNKQERCLQFSINDDKVHLANLHKVKGLQAPVVIMTEARSNNYSPSKHVDYSSEEPQSYLFELKANSYSCLNYWNYDEAKELEQNILEAEKLRLLYVAATRAACSFIATDFRTKFGNGESSQNQAIPMLNEIKKPFEIGDSVDENGLIIFDNSQNTKKKNIISDRSMAEEIYKDCENSCFFNKESELPSYKITRPSSSDIKYALKDDDRPSEDYYNDEVIDASLKGTIVHRFLEVLVNAREFSGDYDKYINQVITEFNTDEDLVKNLLKKAAKSASGFINNLKDAKEIYCEVPFCYSVKKDVICDGVIDLIYCDNKNNWHIVDYKTNYDEDDLELRYAEQLEAYKNAFFKMTGITANVCIEHIAV